MKLLAIDPSSTRTGWAIFNEQHLLNAGYFKPERTRDVPLVRIGTMIDDLKRLLGGIYPVDTAVLEITSGKVAARHHGGGAGLAVYGMAIGALWAVLRERVRKLEAVRENVWTRGVPKAKRQLAIAMLYPKYRAQLAKDSGGDVSDAIGLGRWWIDRQSVEAAEGVLPATAPGR